MKDSTDTKDTADKVYQPVKKFCRSAHTCTGKCSICSTISNRPLWIVFSPSFRSPVLNFTKAGYSTFSCVPQSHQILVPHFVGVKQATVKSLLNCYYYSTEVSNSNYKIYLYISKTS